MPALLAVPASAYAADALNLFPDARTVLVNVVVLGLLIVPVNRLLLQPLMRLLEAREARTAGALARADELRAGAEPLEQRIGERLDRARGDARARRAAVLEETQREERRLIGEAREAAAHSLDAVQSAIAGELEGARKLLQDDARSLAQAVAAKVLGRTP